MKKLNIYTTDPEDGQFVVKVEDHRASGLAACLKDPNNVLTYNETETGGAFANGGSTTLLIPVRHITAIAVTDLPG